jgi:hypothetical protein
LLFVIDCSGFLAQKTGAMVELYLHCERGTMKVAKEETATHPSSQISRDDLIDLLNEDLSGEYQAIISYVVYSQVLRGAEYMNIAGELEKHAA